MKCIINAVWCGSLHFYTQKQVEIAKRSEKGTENMISGYKDVKDKRRNDESIL